MSHSTRNDKANDKRQFQRCLRNLLRSAPRLLALPVLWLLATGVGPIEQGVEAGVDAGGGEYESFGCGHKQRYRYAATRAFVKYRPEDSAMTVSAEASALTSRVIARETSKRVGDSWVQTTERVDVLGDEHIAGAARFGGQWRYFGTELGAGVWRNQYHATLWPTAAFRFHPLPRHTLEIGLLEPANKVFPALYSIQYLYSGAELRGGVGWRPGEQNDMWGEIGYRVTEKNSLGIELHYFDRGVFGPMGAVFVQYRWHTTKPRPASWSAGSDVRHDIESAEGKADVAP